MAKFREGDRMVARGVVVDADEALARVSFGDSCTVVLRTAALALDPAELPFGHQCCRCYGSGIDPKHTPNPAPPASTPEQGLDRQLAWAAGYKAGQEATPPAGPVNAQMLAALRPFADALAEGEKAHGDTLAKLMEALHHISYGELKAARAAIAAAEAAMKENGNG